MSRDFSFDLFVGKLDGTTGGSYDGEVISVEFRIRKCDLWRREQIRVGVFWLIPS